MRKVKLVCPLKQALSERLDLDAAPANESNIVLLILFQNSVRPYDAVNRRPKVSGNG